MKISRTEISFKNNDVIIGSTPNSSTMGSGIETTNKTKNLTN
jgi:hypothetical protein